MGAWEDGRPVYEPEYELSPQQKEEMVQAAKKRREMDYERGRKALKGMLIVFSVTEVLSLVAALGMMPARGVGYGLLACFLSLALTVALVYNIWHGKLWARVFLAVLLGRTILATVLKISDLDTTRIDYSNQQGYNKGITYYMSNDGIKKIQELNREEIALLQEEEDFRVKAHRIIFVVYLIDLAVCIIYLYILFGYRPVKEFFDGQ